MIISKEDADRRLLLCEIIMMIMSLSILVMMIIMGIVFMNLGQPRWMRIVLFSISIIQCLFTGLYCLRIEQTAGYYECKRCRKRYVPFYKDVCLSMHFGRTRKMKCPYCGAKTWHKKVISLTDDIEE